MYVNQIATSLVPVLKCHVMLQKEQWPWTSNDYGLIDEECGDPVESGHAGLCKYVMCNKFIRLMYYH